MCDIQLLIHKNKQLLKKLITELMIEKLICPIETMTCKKLYYNEQTDQLEIDNYSTHQCIFFPSKSVDYEKFELQTMFDLKEVLSFNDFSRFILTYAKKQQLPLEDVYSLNFQDLSILYFFDKSLYKKYTRKQAEEFLKNTIIIIENNQLKFTRKSSIRKKNGNMIEIPDSWLKVLNIENNLEMILTYDEIILRKY